MVGLIRILIHTLAAQAHVCDRHAKPVTGLTMRSRDLSSLGGETDQNLPDNDTVFDVEHGEVEEEADDDDEDDSEDFSFFYKIFSKLHTNSKPKKKRKVYRPTFFGDPTVPQ